MSRLTFLHSVQSIGYEKRALYRCCCGIEKEVMVRSVDRGLTTSCGCYHREVATTHGKSKESIYDSYRSMIKRCYSVNNIGYSSYGGRGIKVCDRWLESFENFYADMGDRPDGTTLDRIKVNGNYELSNCRWADKETQDNNRRNNRFIEAYGEVLTVTQWSRVLEIPVGRLQKRFESGLSGHDVLFKPYRNWRKFVKSI